MLTATLCCENTKREEKQPLCSKSSTLVGDTDRETGITARHRGKHTGPCDHYLSLRIQIPLLRESDA